MTNDVEWYFADPKTGVKRPAVWRDKNDVVHRAVGADVGIANDRIRLMWTACERHDVPVSGAWLQTADDHVDCIACRSVENMKAEDEQEEIRNNGQFGVGA